MDEGIAKLLNAICSLIGLSTLAALSRSILSEDRRSIRGFLRGLVLALFVGVIVGALIQDYSFSPATQGAIVGICGFIADDLLMIVLAITARLRKHPHIIIDYFLHRTGGNSNCNTDKNDKNSGGGGNYGI